MIRIFIDERGSGHDDIILKIDSLPTFSYIADLYYMADFLMIDPEKVERIPQDLGIEYINYLKSKLATLDDKETFIIFDISDEYIGGLLITKKKKGLLQIYYGSTDKIHGYEINKDVLNSLLIDRKPEFDRQGDWLLSYESIIENLNWSIDKINR